LVVGLKTHTSHVYVEGEATCQSSRRSDPGSRQRLQAPKVTWATLGEGVPSNEV
jgi:hypothetical protein